MLTCIFNAKSKNTVTFEKYYIDTLVLLSFLDVKYMVDIFPKLSLTMCEQYFNDIRKTVVNVSNGSSRWNGLAFTTLI